jgi:putative ABC transport system ATP-binding protein
MLSQLNMGLEDKLDVKVGLLSGGQRQALSLLMASMNNPHLLLLDEHTAALDPKSSEAIMNLTDKMIRERDDLTVIMVTHNLNHALRFGNRLIMFHGGDIVEDFDEEEKSNLNQQDLMNLFMQYEYSFSE